MVNRKEIDETFALAYKGMRTALYNLSVYYDKGMGCEIDYKKRDVLLYKSAIRGCSAAQNNLGWNSRKGIGVKQDLQQAVRWFRLAALQGNVLAIHNLGEMLLEGEGLQQDSQMAIRMFLLGAIMEYDELNALPTAMPEKGFATAINDCRYELARLYSMYEDLQKEALFWAILSLRPNPDIESDAREDDRACVNRLKAQKLHDKLLKRMNPEEFEDVKDRLEKWESFRFFKLETTIMPDILLGDLTLCDTAKQQVTEPV